METRKQRNRNRKKKMKFISSLFLIALIGFLGYGINQSYIYIKSNHINKKQQVAKDEREEISEITENIELDNTEEIEIPKTEYVYQSYKIYESEENTEEINFWFGRNTDYIRPEGPLTDYDCEKYNTRFLGNNDKIIYLTFNENTNETQANKNLDILNKYNIKATFFLTREFMENNQDIVSRIVNEGHVCGNLTSNEVNIAEYAKNDPVSLIEEIALTEETFKNITNSDITKIVRFQERQFSIASLDYSNQLGYRTIFHSFAYKDWGADLGSKEEALDMMKTYYHPGAIYLLNGINKSNTEALEEFIEYMQGEGYSFDVITNID